MGAGGIHKPGHHDLDYDPDQHVLVPIMQFEDGQPLNDSDVRVDGRFPGQTITVSLIAKSSSDDPANGVLSKSRLPGAVRLVHIPSNNMTWVEQAMASYYGEERPDLSRQRGTMATSQTAMLLRESHWRSQSYGLQMNPTSRFMRPFCDSVSTGYYTTLSSTRAKDRTQVVYRATTPEVGSHHRFNAETRQWEGHEYMWGDRGCRQCRTNIREVSRVVMVDQLWMWMLDNQTIVACFPRRYGTTGHDPSGVFEAVKARLSSGKPANSACDIALVIMDECSNTFFNRTKDYTGQPRVLDAFSEAIRGFTQKQTVEFGDSGTGSIEPEESTVNKAATLTLTLQYPIGQPVSKLDTFKQFIHHVLTILSKQIDLNQTEPAHLDRFKVGAEDLLRNVRDRVDYLEKLLKSASAAADVVKDLSQLRQQQDSVVQALQSVKLSKEGFNQGRTIMVFTVVTIIFSPLSFMSSIFGMKNAEFGDNQLTIEYQLKLTCMY
ncbi:Uu.00g108060.m01.CDS01 [Anthostomella pinea]|uniref:Uu.00g108060.m01.CDS01 n=1 Tax=Anthostomella pinea TaxID=933095 RepID=A0AAI8VFG9_9PEZI|nr:Uu.00g108060.m01.CDS01 [Anthostomella pinea]